MDRRRLGKTELFISPLGIGLSEIGNNLSKDDFNQASKVLNSALDNGINFLDTAARYGISEETIGEAISNRRNEYILATKASPLKSDSDDWSYNTIISSIERSLVRMKTDYIDLLQLHSPTIEILERGEIIKALKDSKQSGKVRYIGYSGDNENAIWAIKSGEFNTLQTSFSIVDQSARKSLFPLIKNKNMGLIAKRPIGNGVWGKKIDPDPMQHLPGYTKEYFRRWNILNAEGLTDDISNPIKLCLGFTLYHNEVNVAIVGSQRPDHVTSNVSIIKNELPISNEIINKLYDRCDSVGNYWPQQG